MRVLDLNSKILAQGGSPEGAPKFPSRWWDRVEKHERLGTLVDTAHGKALVVMLPLRIPRAPRTAKAEAGSSDQQHRPFDTSREPHFNSPDSRGGPQDGPHTAYVLEAAVSLKAVAGSFEGLRQNLIHVGGDFYDIFEAESGKVVIVLGDVSGKGVPAALLVSVLQGAIRSSTASQHESACERFATVFWGVFDPSTDTLHYVNAGHAAPMLVRDGGGPMERLREGGPVLGLLPDALYSAGIVKIENGDSLIVYSDGVSEAANKTKKSLAKLALRRSFQAARMQRQRHCAIKSLNR
ncbi:MAG TPA: PP2C family protein-serine/threonine phosphatase [Bryobacteraceae bacterium]|jgi:serine phosphatase RsbU (regulator of sigma subunit)|nr:PP2C family protein-serine/threonine phosphatase [Bryobacteraceae bacterium]